MPTKPPDNTPLPLSRKARRTREQPISYLMAAAVGNPKLISFAAGLVDYETLPVQETAAALEGLLGDPLKARRALQYGTTPGDPDLRRQLLDHLCRLEGVTPAELSLSIEDVLVTTGSQQGLYLLTDVLVDEGDIVIAANPSYFVYTGLLQSFGADVRTVPMDEGGIVVEAVAELLGRLERDGELPKLKVVYCQSYYQNPTGLTLAADRREPLVELVRQYSRRAGHRIVLLEDAAYRELGYESEASLPSLKRYDPGNEFVASSYTFSKPFAPGVKTGYCFLPRGLADPVLQQKGNHDFGSPNLCQALLRDVMREGAYHAHLTAVREGYRRRRDLTLAALQEHLGGIPGISWTKPAGGLYVWLTLPPQVDTGREGLLFKAIVECDVLYVPGVFCFQPDAAGCSPSHHMRLCYGVVPLEKIGEGIGRLASCIKAQMKKPGADPMRSRNVRAPVSGAAT